MAINADFTTGNLNGFTFDRDDEQTIVDFEGVLKTIPTTVQGVQGARVVTNIVLDGAVPIGANWNFVNNSGTATVSDETDYVACHFDNDSDGINQTVTSMEAGKDYILSAEMRLRPGSTGTRVRFRIYTGLGFLTLTVTVTSDWQRFTMPSTNITAVSGTPAVHIRGHSTTPLDFDVRNVMFEDVTGQIDTQEPSSYISGTSYYNYRNGNTVDAFGVVTEAQGTAITGIEGILLEDARTNQLLHSGDASNAAWSLSGITDGGADSSSGQNGRSLVIDSGTSSHFLLQDSTLASGIQYSMSAVVEPNGQRYIQFTGSTGFNTADIVNFDLVAGTITSNPTSVPANITALGNGFFLIQASFLSSATSGRLIVAFVNSGAAARLPSFTGNGTDAATISLSMEEGDFSSSYIPTEGSSVARVTTSMTRALVVPANNFNVTLVATMQFDYDDVKAGADVSLLELSDGTADNVFSIAIDATTDQIHMTKTVATVSTGAETFDGDLLYSAGDELTIQIVSNEYGIHLKVNSLTWVTNNSATAEADWVSLLDQIELMPAFVAVKSLTLSSTGGGGSGGGGIVTSIISQIV